MLVVDCSDGCWLGVVSAYLCCGCVDIVPFANRSHQQFVSVNEGQAVIIDLPPVDCYPAPTIYWRNILTGVKITGGGGIQHYHLTLDNELVILSTQLSRDNGTVLRAVARNIYTLHSTQSSVFHLSVNGKRADTQLHTV